jgi:hypothetical protein
MSIFQKIKAAKAAAEAEKNGEVVEDKIEKKKKPARSSLFKKIGVKVEKAPTEDDERALKRHAEEREVWNYIRHQIDLGSQTYLATGETKILSEYLRGSAYQAMIDSLNKLKVAGIKIQENPNAIAERKNNRFEIVNERLNPNGQPSQFTLRERFQDNTVFYTDDGRQSAANGAERTIQATIDVEGQNYQVSSVVRVHK